MARRKLPKVKGITRIDEPGGHGVGWYARVRYQGVTYSKYFADMSHQGTDAAFEKALKWRNAKEKELGKPRTDRVVNAGPAGRVPGVYQLKQSFVVAFSPSPGVRHREFVSIRKYGYDEAYRRAVALRRKYEKEAYGKAVSEMPKPKRRFSLRRR